MPGGSAGTGAWQANSPGGSNHRARVALILGCALAPVCCAADAPPADRAAELVRMVRQDCGSCHGMQLTGGLGPALTPQALAGKSGEALAATVLQGRHGTAMPPWRPFLSEAEAGWIVEQLRRGFPDEK